MSSSNDGSHNTRVTGHQLPRVTVSVDQRRLAGHRHGDRGRRQDDHEHDGLFDTNGQAADLVTAPSGGNPVRRIFDGMSLALLTGDSASPPLLKWSS
jgi:hypothetical protein